MSDDLATWLRVRLDEDEQAAEDVHDRHCPKVGETGAEWTPVVCDCDWPARVLAEVAAKRAIVELHALDVRSEPARFDTHTGEPIGPEYDVNCAVCGWASSDPTSGCATLRLLALPYAGHAGYRSEWAPDE